MPKCSSAGFKQGHDWLAGRGHLFWGPPARDGGRRWPALQAREQTCSAQSPALSSSCTSRWALRSCHLMKQVKYNDLVFLICGLVTSCTHPFHPHHGHVHRYNHQGAHRKGHRGLWKSAHLVWFSVDGERFVQTALQRKRLPGRGRGACGLWDSSGSSLSCESLPPPLGKDIFLPCTRQSRR